MSSSEYRQYVASLSQLKEALYQTISRRVSKGDKATLEAINYRRQILSERDINVASAYLPLNICSDICVERRLAAICIVLEAEFDRDKSNITRKCAPYEKSKLFSECYQLSEYERKDLISTNAFKKSETVGTVRIGGNKWARLDGSLSANILDWLLQHKDKNTFIRLNPNEVYDKEPSQLILEFLLTPPNPNWWKDLKVYNRTKEGCAFFLDGGDVHNTQDYWDYYIKGVRGLQVLASRDNKGNLVMTLEELSEKCFILDPTKKIVTGRMIHLDTDAPIGTPFRNARLNHLDLALNYYFDAAADRRLAENLATGQRIEDATERTHIARIEDIAFPELFFAAYGFFQSKILLDEWKDSQFKS